MAPWWKEGALAALCGGVLYLDQMPLVYVVVLEEKEKGFKGSQHTSDAIWQKIDVVENICRLKIALKDLLQTDATDFKNLGIR